MDNSEVEDFERQYPYHIIEFVAAGRKPRVKKIDIVATKWLRFNEKKKRCCVKFPPPPYTDEKSEQYNLSLQALMDAPNDWQEYSVNIRGRASKYELLKLLLSISIHYSIKFLKISIEHRKM